ncbi:hypothetical protein O6H91_21G002000 [Diphasiastrum complanatum]|uniref:Uncharacterized protein n=1 Tax=Diphasiastrum complanatum TaxID=34168 RepID=A0ACC2AH31_DIPCM|nr:hypothetical protein O6H91_Y461800 [Diphasiastrum complanatum]KAJ7516862.1 hypothetical protein O6H91_21G002000 [Diphasiastrum complanatum]
MCTLKDGEKSDRMVAGAKQDLVDSDGDKGLIIPDLSEQVALLCLLRIPRLFHAGLRAVSTHWNNLLRGPDFYAERKRLGFTDAWLVVFFTDVVASSFSCCMYDLRSRQMLCRVRLHNFGLHHKLELESYKLGAIGSSIVIIEGRKSPLTYSDYNHTKIYDTVSNKWRDGATMLTRRSHFAMGVIGNRLYVAGGCNRSGTLASVEAYDLKKNEWATVASMPFGLESIQDEVVFQGKLYVFGHPFANKHCVVFVYDPIKDIWEQDVQMGMSMVHDGELVATDNCIYSVSTSDCFRKYDRDDGKWHLVGVETRPRTKVAFNRHAQRAFGLGNELFLLRGELGGSTIELNANRAVCHNLFLGESWFRAGAIVHA